MAKYEEMKRLSPDKVRNLCIKKDWYTRGDVNAYAAMLDKVWKIEESEKSITPDQLGELRQSARGLAKCRTWRADAGERRQLRGIYRLSGRGRRIRGNVGGSSRQQTPLA